MLSYGDAIYVESMVKKMNGTVRDGILVSIKGLVSKDWASGKNAYGGSINQPFIYAHEVTVIPEEPPE